MNGKHVAGQIATKVQGYWDGYAAKKDRAKVMEEKRLRALAKSTVKMVITEWKKAVFVCASYIVSSFSERSSVRIAYPGTGTDEDGGRGETPWT
jgi:hypothetical protein